MQLHSFMLRELHDKHHIDKQIRIYVARTRHYSF